LNASGRSYSQREHCQDWRFGTTRGSAHTPTYAGGESPAEHRDRDRSREDRGSTGGYG
uniref:Transposase n=1 Tax=Anisakis simplex TaxID=6269 RepID=A0A0M3KKR4_ANISI